MAALADAGVVARELALGEAHGTGTALGDPIEAGSLTGAVLSARAVPLAVGGVKANLGTMTIGVDVMLIPRLEKLFSW